MMSLERQISDEEMQYYQFKARQMFLLKKEDHEWNQFCKRNTCTCCMCIPASHERIRNVGIQTSGVTAPRPLSKKGIYRTSSENKTLPNSLTEIRAKLDELDLSLAKVLTTQEKEVSNRMVSTKFTSAKSSASDEKAVKDERLDIIHAALKGSIQRLQSAANGQKKSSGLVLPRHLQEQRAAARRAYLASLDKLKNKRETNEGSISSSKTPIFSKGPPQKPVPKKPKPVSSRGKFISNRGKSIHKKFPSVPQERKHLPESIITAVQSTETKDENIENAIDVMIDDLIGETALSILKIRYLKKLKNSENKLLEGKRNKLPAVCEERKLSGEKTPHSSHWEKIRNNLPHLIRKMDVRTETADATYCKTGYATKSITKQADPELTLLQDTLSKTVNPSAPLSKTKIFINSKSLKEVSNHRKEFWKYLNRINQTKKGNFNPWTLSNMVAESLLDDCILDVSKELQDVPSDLIMGLYDQEFLLSLNR